MDKASVWLGIVAAGAAGIAFAGTPLQGEIQIEAASKLEGDAGLWLDGQYIGTVNELGRRGRIVVVPGEHELLFKLIGYSDVQGKVIAEPGARQEYRLAMSRVPGAVYPEKANTAQLRLDVKPADAAIFINDSFIGRSERFGGRQGVRLAPGDYRITIALPGYQAFTTEVSLRAGQTYGIETDLRRGRVEDQAPELSATRAPGPVNR